MVGFDVIADLLSATRRRLSLLHAACGASEATAVAAAAALAAALLTLVASPPPLRTVAALVGLGGLSWAAWRHGWLARRTMAGEEAVARLVEHRTGVAGVLTAVQLRRDLDRPHRARAMSAQLAEAAIAQVGRRVEEVEARDVAPAAPIKPRVLALLLVALAWSMVWALAPDSLRLGLARLISVDDLASAEGLTERVPDALAGDLTLRYRFAEYTGTPDRRVEGAWGDIQALKGTVVSLQARAFEPVDGGTVIITPDEGTDGQTSEVPLMVEAGRTVSGELTVAAPGSWRFSFRRPGGGRAEEEGGRRIEVLEDARPRVELLEPSEDSEVEATDVVTISWRARDDYGVTGQRLVWQVAGAGGDPQSVDLQDFGGPGGREAFGQHQLPLKTLDVQPGDVLNIFMEATDNNSVDGPRVGQSEVRVLRIRSPLDRHNEQMARLRVFWDKTLDHLADRLEAEPEVRRPEDFPAIRKNVDKLNEDLSGLAAAADELVRAFADDVLARADVQDGLRAVRDAFERDLREEFSAAELAFRAKQRGRLTAGVLGALRKAGDRAVDDVEKALLRLEDLTQDQAMQDLDDLTRQLVKSQERLRSLLEKYKDAPDLQTKRRIEREIARLKSRIADLMRRLGELMKQVPMEHLNRGALEKGAASKAMDLATRLQAIQDALAKGDMDAAMAALEQLEKDMQALSQQLQDDRRERDREQDTVTAELGAIREALKQVRTQQDKVSEETQAVEQAAVDRRKEVVEDRLQEFLERELAKVEALGKAIRQMPPEALGRNTTEKHRRLGRHAERLGEALGRHDLDMAREIAGEAEILSQELQRDVGWRLPGALSPFTEATPNSRRARRSADDSAALAREIKRDLDALLPGADAQGGRGFDEQERAGLERLTHRQSGLERQARQLQERMQALEEQLPMEAGEMSEGFERAAQHMDGAGDELRRMAPKPAGRAQGEASAELEGLDQRLERMMKPNEQGKRPGEGDPGDTERGGRGPMNRDRVDIDADKANPELFRRDILEAMKRQGPAAYEEQVRQYYRELVK